MQKWQEQTNTPGIGEDGTSNAIKTMSTSTDVQQVSSTKETNQQEANSIFSSTSQEEVNISEKSCISSVQQNMSSAKEICASNIQPEVISTKEMCSLINQQKMKLISTSTNQQEVNSAQEMCTSIEQQEVNSVKKLCASTDHQDMNPFKEVSTSGDTIKSPNLEKTSTSTDQQKSKPAESNSTQQKQRKLQKNFSLKTSENVNEDVEQETLPETKEIKGHVGFTNILKQAFAKVVKKGFEFNLMVVGESGLGKSTLINSMFLADIYNTGPMQRFMKTVTVEATSVVLKEDGVILLLTVIDTPGFGDAIDNNKSWEPISKYIDDKFEEFLYSETLPIRKQTRDERVHCCLYFIRPTGHGLRPLDIEFMKRLCNKVNIIPVIGKADTLTPDECAFFKKKIMLDIAKHEIKMYDFPDPSNEMDNLNTSLKKRIPFAVVGSNAVIEINGRKIRGRNYPWGVVEIDNLEHCDFVALRTMMISTHMESLKDVTNNIYYENYRLAKLANFGPNVKPLRKSKLVKDEQELKNKLEAEMREKERQLTNSMKEANKRLDIARKEIEEEAKELVEKKKQFELEKDQWEKESYGTLEAWSRRRTMEADRGFIDEKREKSTWKKGFFKK